MENNINERYVVSYINIIFAPFGVACVVFIYMYSSFEEVPGGDYLIWLILWLVSLGVSLTLPNAHATRGVGWEGFGDWKGSSGPSQGGEGGAGHVFGVAWPAGCLEPSRVHSGAEFFLAFSDRGRQRGRWGCPILAPAAILCRNVQCSCRALLHCWCKDGAVQSTSGNF